MSAVLIQLDRRAHAHHPLAVLRRIEKVATTLFLTGTGSALLHVWVMSL